MPRALATLAATSLGSVRRPQNRSPDPNVLPQVARGYALGVKRRHSPAGGALVTALRAFFLLRRAFFFPAFLPAFFPAFLPAFFPAFLAVFLDAFFLEAFLPTRFATRLPVFFFDAFFFAVRFDDFFAAIVSLASCEPWHITRRVPTVCCTTYIATYCDVST